MWKISSEDQPKTQKTEIT